MDIDPDRIESELRLPVYRDLTATLDYLVRTLSGSIYIEDISGRLLFAPSTPQRDDWRQNFTPLSLPTVDGYERSLRVWSRSGRSYIAIPGDQSFQDRRTVIPLTYQGQIFAFVHLVNSRFTVQPLRAWNEAPASDAETRLVAILGDKLFMLVVGRFNELRHADVPDNLPSDETPVTCVVSTLARGLGDHPADRILDHVSVAKLAAQSLDDAMQSPIKRAVETRIVEQDDELQLVQRLFSRSTPDLEALKEEYRGVIDGLGWRLDVGLSAIAEGRDRAKRAEAEARALVSMAAPGHGSTRLFTRSDGSLHSLHLLRSATADFNRYTDHIRSALVAADPLLASTAAAYAQTECNASDTASRLGVDRRTINHRLHRIAELTGLDLPTFPAKIILYLAFLPEMRLE